MDYKIYLNEDGKVILKDGKVWFFKNCPCVCLPKVIGSKKVNGSDPKTAVWDMREFKEDGIGTPFSRWRLVEVDNPRYCYRLYYCEGEIDECGRLIGLPDIFTSTYDYDGYMEIQQGCKSDTGEWIYPCPE